MLGIVYRCIATYLIRKVGFSRKTAQTGAVTLIQRFGSALNVSLICAADGPPWSGGPEVAEEPFGLDLCEFNSFSDPTT